MAITHPARRLAHQRSPSVVGPQISFAAAILIVFAVLAVSAGSLPRDFALPLASTLFFALAALAALAGWLLGHTSRQDPPTYWDVAGALTFIGVCAASMVDPDQMIRIVESAYRES